jgi:hypothetical protein
VLAAQVGDDQPAIALLDVRYLEAGGFRAPQRAAEEQRQDGAIALAFERGRIRQVDELLGLLAGQPVPCPGAALFGAWHLTDADGDLRSEHSGERRFPRQFPDRGQALVNGQGAVPGVQARRDKLGR